MSAADGLTIGDLMDEIVGLNDIGFDWYVSPTPQGGTFDLHLWCPRKNNASITTLDNHNIKFWAIQRFGSMYRNKFYVLASDDSVVQGIDTNTNLTDWGMRSILIKDSGVQNSNAATKRYNQEVAKRHGGPVGGTSAGDVPYYLNITVDSLTFPWYDPSFFNPGDTVSVTIRETSFLDLNATPFRVIGYQVTVDSEGGETVALYFNNPSEGA